MSLTPYPKLKKSTLGMSVQDVVDESPAPLRVVLEPETEGDTWRMIVERTDEASAGKSASTRGGLSRGLKRSVPMLCIHGVGHEEADGEFQTAWTNTIQNSLSLWNPDLAPSLTFLSYDSLFESAPLGALDVARALARLTASGVIYGIGDLLGLSRGFGQVSEQARWTAGMVAQWADNSKLRTDAEDRLLDQLENSEIAPQLILAHSLGSLLAYGAFSRKNLSRTVKERLAQATLVTFGSQIGNPFVRSTLAGGRIRMLPVKQWYHLFNPHDDAFTAHLVLRPESSGQTLPFAEIVAEFDLPGMLDHDAVAYLGHERTNATVWREAAGAGTARSLAASLVNSEARVTPSAGGEVRRKLRSSSKPVGRALLVGINDYPNPENRLEGCVNDTYLVSAVLQDRGFKPEHIRLLLNDRATTAGLRERLDWLLEGSEDGSPRVLFFSGHGAQIPDYGIDETADHTDECLVTYDFNWDAKTAFTDDVFYELYSQLPDSARFLAIFDCCHSGGIARDGGLRVRGLNPPDDIRHRALRWDSTEQMWVSRDLNAEPSKDYTKRGWSHRRMGRGLVSQNASSPEGRQQHYLPLLLEACSEGEQAFEYRDGVNGYGAFTFCVAQVLRDPKLKNLSWNQLVQHVSQKLRRLHYRQKPKIEGHARMRRDFVPAAVKGGKRK